MEEILKNIIGKAIYASSGDNSQPWQFVVRGNTVLLYNLPDRDLPFYNFCQFGSYVAHGGVIENMLIAGSELGVRPDITLFPTGEKEHCVARLVFHSTSPHAESLFPYIEQRCTNRKPYRMVPLTDNERLKLSRVQGEVGEGEILFSEDTHTNQRLARAVAANETIALEVPELHHDFFGHMVWSKREEQEKKMGLYIKTLELPPPLQALFRVIRYSFPVRVLNAIGFSRFAALGNAKIYGAASALAAIVVPQNTKEDYVLAGRLMQRLWLTITSLGLSLQPVTGLLFLAQRVFAGEANGLSARHVKLIRDGYQAIAEAFNVPQEKTIVLMVRIGHGGEPSARSSRLPPNIIIEHV